MVKEVANEHAEELIDLNKQAALSPAEIVKGIQMINKSSPKAIYRRPDGNLTRPLPADPYSVMMYFAKGFKAP